MTVEQPSDTSSPAGGDGVYEPTFGFESDYLGRIIRALTTRMTTTELAPNLFLVETDDDAYHVDLEGRVCECPDCEYRDMTCKHYFRVLLEAKYDLDPYPLWKDSDLVAESDVEALPSDSPTFAHADD